MCRYEMCTIVRIVIFSHAHTRLSYMRDTHSDHAIQTILQTSNTFLNSQAYTRLTTAARPRRSKNYAGSEQSLFLAIVVYLSGTDFKLYF